MSLKDKIVADIKEAVKSGDQKKRDALRFLVSAIQNVEIEKKKKEEGLNDEEVVEVIARSIKQHKDSVAQYEQGGRADLAAKEKKEIEILSVYMPSQAKEEEIRSEVKAAIAQIGAASMSDVGKVMGEVMKKLKGKADGNEVRKIVLEELSVK